MVVLRSHPLCYALATFVQGTIHTGNTDKSMRSTGYSLLKLNSRLKRRPAGSLVLIGLLGVLIIGLGSCFGRSQEPLDTVDTIDRRVDEPSLLTNQQTDVKITVPAEWISAGDDLRSSADIYASYPIKELYVSVLSESGAVLDQFSLEDNADQYRWLIEEEMGSAYESATRTDVQQIDGKPAIQYEIRGRVDGTPVVYLHTTVKGENRYYQVVGWTNADSYSDNKAALQTIIRSFQGQ